MGSSIYITRRWRRLREAKLVEQPLCEAHLKRQQLVPATTVRPQGQHSGRRATRSR